MGEKVRNKIRETFGKHTIPQDQITYTQKQGLQVYQDLRLQKQLKWEFRNTTKELGSFCKIFNDSLPKTMHYNTLCSKKPSSKTYKRPPKKPLKMIPTTDVARKVTLKKYGRVFKKLQELKLKKETFQRVSALITETSTLLMIKTFILILILILVKLIIPK